ncbi:hypothetical protein M406DRAFT_319982 [Cryphonectria parasitica EP155]|uniref:Autophagy-related protein 16 domain-containing protein n=1 Tax=Cryphonectria parasitica (strain ATCC 38755 / EP155) TaxID=660469 RepID=A0A9P4YBF5_CRYP1|nr:uncharacterized protein M406DRAFT_319982 [Cryphonectria parasitica EP155]KAF3769590.1 hypothetical protein M406DRAFT_319982 [Cryphonectria parasitica EP155]
MPGWKDDYLSSLLEAERNSPVNLALVDACSQLNDKIALLEAEKAQAVQPPLSASTTTPSSPPIPSASTTLPSTDPVLLRLRADLAQALRQNTALATRLRAATADRDRLQGLTKTQEATIATLTTERGALSRRVRDQAEELRGKKQMLEQVQDEVLTLEMQLNVAEQQKTKIAAENKNLIDRWMRRAELEAREMNAANERGGPEGT